MPLAWAIGGSAVLGFLGAKEQAGAAESASNLQYQATQDAARQQREMFDILNEQQKPYREAGYSALSRIGEMLPGLTKPVSREEILGLPGYQFAIEQGTGAARQGMNVGSPGSNVDRAAQKFALDYTIGTAMPQVISQRQNIYNTLAGIAGIGQTAQSNAQNLGMTTSSNLAQLGLGGASAIGAGQIGAANVMAGAAQGIGNAGMMYQFLRPQTPTSAVAPAGYTPSGGVMPPVDYSLRPSLG